MRNVTGQSAIEYLMTYGWMLLVVAIVGGAIFSMVGDQTIESVSGFEAQDIMVDDFGATTSGLQMVIGSGVQKSTIKQAKISEGDNNAISIPLNHEISLNDPSVLNLPQLHQASETNDIEMELTYNTGNLENLTASGTITGNIQIDRSLIGYWVLDEHQANTTHAFDLSGSENHGRVESPNFVSSTITRQSAEYDGNNDAITVSEDKDYEFDLSEDDFSLITLVKIDQKEELDDYENRMNILGKNTPSEGYGLTVNNGGEADSNPGELESINFKIREEELGNRNAASLSDPEPEKWYHIAGVYSSDTQTLELYINGTKADEASIPFDQMNHTADEFEIGGTGGVDGGGGYFKGNMGYAMVYQRALSPNEINDIYSNPRVMQ